MLIPSSYKGIYEKVLRTPDGRLVRVQFAVVEVNGAFRGRVISMEPIEDRRLELGVRSHEKNAEILCLPCSSEAILSPISYLLSPALLVSPYTSLDFFMSQPTRAPSAK